MTLEISHRQDRIAKFLFSSLFRVGGKIWGGGGEAILLKEGDLVAVQLAHAAILQVYVHHSYLQPFGPHMLQIFSSELLPVLSLQIVPWLSSWYPWYVMEFSEDRHVFSLHAHQQILKHGGGALEFKLLLLLKIMLNCPFNLQVQSTISR